MLFFLGGESETKLGERNDEDVMREYQAHKIKRY